MTPHFNPRLALLALALLPAAAILASGGAVDGGRQDAEEDLAQPAARLDTPAVAVPLGVDSDADEVGASGLPEDERTDPLAVSAQQAVDRGLAYLALQQVVSGNSATDGAWINDIGYKLNYDYVVTRYDGYHPGVTAIACLAFMANGHLPGRGRYGDVVRRGLNFVLRSIPSEGESNDGDGPLGYASNDGSRMYTHSFCTLFLAEVLGMANLSPEQELVVQRKLRAAVNVIREFQNGKGAWRYQPGNGDADMSIAVCQLQALRAARAAGTVVRPDTIRRAREYVAKGYNAESNWLGPRGSFVYQWDEPATRYSWTLTAAGVVAMQSAGNYTSFTHEGRTYSLAPAIEFLTTRPPLSLEQIQAQLAWRQGMEFGYFYGHYYAAQAIYQYDIEIPGLWDRWIASVRRKFNALQRPGPTLGTGYWEDEVGTNYATAMACLVLQIHHQYLPIFHR